MAGALLVLAGCTGLRTSEPAARTIEIDGLSYKVGQLTASTWTAAPKSAPAAGLQKTATLVRAIEKASACKVTDSSYGQQGKVFTAQVDCGSKLKD